MNPKTSQIHIFQKCLQFCTLPNIWGTEEGHTIMLYYRFCHMNVLLQLTFRCFSKAFVKNASGKTNLF